MKISQSYLGIKDGSKFRDYSGLQQKSMRNNCYTVYLGRFDHAGSTENFCEYPTLLFRVVLIHILITNFGFLVYFLGWNKLNSCNKL